MNLEKTLTEIRAAKCACFCYEQTGRPRFRDRVSIYHDGKLLFERFCYGEAAGKACEMWASGLNERNEVLWDYDSCAYSQKDEAPKKLTGAGSGGLVFDGKVAIWTCVEQKKKDPAHGYGFFAMLFRRIFK